MKLTEIIKVSPLTNHGITFSNIDMDQPTEVFTVDGYPVYQYNEKDKGSSKLFVLRIDNTDAAYVAHSYITIRGQTYPYLTRAFTIDKYRGKGYALKIIVQLRNFYNTKILSDENLTPDGIKLWKRLATILPVKVYDFTTGETKDIKDVPEHELYTDEQHNKHVFVIERLSALHNEQTQKQRIHEGVVVSYNVMALEQDELLSFI